MVKRATKGELKTMSTAQANPGRPLRLSDRPYDPAEFLDLLPDSPAGKAAKALANPAAGRTEQDIGREAFLPADRPR